MDYLQQQEAQWEETFRTMVPQHWWELLGHAQFWLIAAALAGAWLMLAPQSVRDWLGWK